MSSLYDLWWMLGQNKSQPPFNADPSLGGNQTGVQPPVAQPLGAIKSPLDMNSNPPATSPSTNPVQAAMPVPTEAPGTLHYDPFQAQSDLNMTPTQPASMQPQPGLSDFWKQPMFGSKGPPMDLGVTLAGMLAQALAPNEFGGRLGATLANLGGQAYTSRMKQEQEAPEQALRNRYITALTEKAERPEKVTTPAPQYDEDVRQDPITGQWMVIERIKGTNTITSERPATEHELATKINKPTGDKTTTTNLGKLIAERDALIKVDPTDPDIAHYDAIIKRETGPVQKETNVANEIDTILGGMFPGYYTDAEIRKKALEYYATPEGSQKVQEAAANYAKSKVYPTFTPVVTTEGVQSFQTRGPSGGTIAPQQGATPSKPLPEAAMKEFGALAALQTSADKIVGLMQEEYVGPVKGRYYSMAENIINLPEKQVKFNAYVNDIKDALLRARSGAQINEQEYKRLVKFLPSVDLPYENFKARLDRFKEQVGILQIEKAKTYSGQGYKIDVSTGTQTGIAPTNNKGYRWENGKLIPY